MTRTPDGLCRACARGERGPLVARATTEHPGSEHDEPRRWLQDVVEPGDR